MRLQQIRGRVRRPGFTLIELLVVIAIIAVLVSLLMSGVMAVLQQRELTATRYEIAKLDTSLKAAMEEYLGRPQTLPGKLVLYNNIDVYRNPSGYGITAATNPNLQDVSRSADALRKMFGKRFISTAAMVNWDGTGNASSVVILEGQQCLVFYLGGMPVTSGNFTEMKGFSTDPLNPTAPGGERIGPFYQFESHRLSNSGTPAGFFNYLDRYGTPFAYFGGTGGSNTYVSHSPSLPPSGVSAYVDSTGKFANPNRFQIISAGKNKRFGAGGLWDPSRGSTDPNAEDDLSNFSTAPLKSPQN